MVAAVNFEIKVDLGNCRQLISEVSLNVERLLRIWQYNNGAE